MRKKMTFIISILVLIYACNTENEIDMDKTELSKISMIDMAAFKELATKKIFFGHMSVGDNILNGARKVAEKNNLPVSFISLSDKNKKLSNAIIDSKIGKNHEPISKINDFYSILNDSSFSELDVAFFKFCYIDFNKDTDIEEIFKAYVNTIDTLRRKHPEVLFVHTTVPLRSIQSGPKAIVKRILGRSIGYEDNMARNKFNNLLVDKYKGKSPIFDIALFESTYSDGRREFKIIDNEPIYSLIPEYTYDSGHLTREGEDFLGEQFLIFLSQLYH